MTLPPSALDVEWDSSAPELRALCQARFGLIDLMLLGMSPMVFRCNEEWMPIFKLCEDRFGYCWEWLADDPTEVVEPWLSRYGKAVFKKV